MIYAGIGSRQTPPNILARMQLLGTLLGYKGHILRTGACKGADQAFANGAILTGQVQLCLPWKSYEKEWVDSLKGDKQVRVLSDKDIEAYASVDKFHPAAKKLSQGARKLHARNFLIVNGVDFIICWTPEGKVVGGTGQALRIAEDIPVYNLFYQDAVRHIILKYT